MIHPQWVLTVAHTIFYDYQGKNLNISGIDYEIERVVKHPEYAEPSKKLFTGDAAPLMDFLTSRSDIALIKLKSPVVKATPIALYSKTDELTKIFTSFGKGATGNGLIGEDLSTKPHQKSNHFQNVIETASDNWVSYKFYTPNDALPLEGMHGSGDSGGASIIYQDGIPYLVGLSSWQIWNGELKAFKGGLYGTTAYQVRVSSYLDWISKVTGINFN